MWDHDRTNYLSFMIRKMTVFSIVNRGRKILVLSKRVSSSYRMESHHHIEEKAIISFRRESRNHFKTTVLPIINLKEKLLLICVKSYRKEREGLCLLCNQSVWIISKWKAHLNWSVINLYHISKWQIIYPFEMNIINHFEVKTSIISKWQQVIISKRRDRDNSGKESVINLWGLSFRNESVCN